LDQSKELLEIRILDATLPVRHSDASSFYCLSSLVTHRSSPSRYIVSHCRLHHLPFSKIEAIEKDEALLVLRLYKLLAHLMARRQEITIEQLATLHSIMSSPAMKNPSRKSSRAI
jgi:hypothetical protein